MCSLYNEKMTHRDRVRELYGRVLYGGVLK